MLQSKNEEDFCPSNIWNEDNAFGNDEKKADDFEAEVFKYAQNNIVTLTMFIREPFAEKIVTAEKISRISFMSDVGGLLGLFMGFSFVSAVEIIYHAFKVSTIIIIQKNSKFFYDIQDQGNCHIVLPPLLKTFHFQFY